MKQLSIIIKTASLIIALIYTSIHSFAQQADVTIGCIPLNVEFTSPQANTYFWDFGDGTSSDLQNPSHAFTESGQFVVTLYDNMTDLNAIGTIEITVFRDLIIDLNASERDGCTPLEIFFDASIQKDNEVTLDGFLWAFGDGGGSTTLNTSYVYNNPGLFDISLEVTTNFTECNRTILLEDYIEIENVEAAFTASPRSECDIPATITLNNTSPDLPGNTYFWDFDNGQTSTEYNPGTVTYTEIGTYLIRMTARDTRGCQTQVIRTVRIGEPILDFMVFDSTCAEIPIEIINESGGTSHLWNFGPGAEVSDSTIRNPTVTYSSPGLRTVTYRNFAGTCSSDTTFEIFVASNIADFDIDPKISCGDNVMHTLTADYKGLDLYIWNDTIVDGPIITLPYEEEERDSFYINRTTAITYKLFASDTSTSGGMPIVCVDSLEKTFLAQLPEAFFIPDSVIGEAPLLITFRDSSTSSEAIVERFWNFGDGNTITTTDSTDLIQQHLFTEPGEYYVTLTITTDTGCVDRSIRVRIIVVPEDDNPPPGGGTDIIIVEGSGGTGQRIFCVGDTTRFILPASPLFDYKLITDEQRFSQCWPNRTASHIWHFPGVFPMTLSKEFKGFEVERYVDFADIEINGARAEIQYEKNCDNIFEIDLSSISLNATDLIWFDNGVAIGQEESFTYIFDTPGEHIVTLEASNNDGLCPPDRDTIIVNVSKPTAEFEIPDMICAFNQTPLDASQINGSESCNSINYLWEFDLQRPSSTSEPVLNHDFVPGTQNIILTVTDEYGCTASATQSTTVYGTDLVFDLDSTICLPADRILENTTTSDTTIVSWEWNFGSTEQSPSYTITQDAMIPFNETFFFENDLDPEKNYIQISLTSTDALGCTYTLDQFAEIYVPESSIIMDDVLACTGSAFPISATDFTQQGSCLTYEWSINGQPNATGQTPDLIFDENGVNIISMTFTEKSSGCTGIVTDSIDVLQKPEANFTTSADTIPVLCSPATIEFTNTSITDGETFYNWNFGNSSSSELENPVISYDRGTYDVVFTATSVQGCQDSIIRTFELVGPAGFPVIDDPDICLGETITLSVTDLEDVSDYLWDLGDGTIIENQSPITHIYNFRPESDETKIDLILKSADTGCELIQTIPITINEVIADFESVPGQDYCLGLIGLISTSVGADILTWDLGDGTILTEPNITHVYDQGGEFEISLNVEDSQSGCTDEISITQDVGENIEFYDFPNVFTPNNDGRNDRFRPVFEPQYRDAVSIEEFKIYNRWGELIYDNENGLDGWDGRQNGQLVQEDVYAYYIALDIIDCEKVIDKGNVTLVR